MTKSEFENLLCRAGELARDKDFFLIGSQSLRGVSPAIPRDFPKTIEADLYPRRHPQAWAILRGELGSDSKFFDQHGYYLDCVGPGLATLPTGWTERLIPFRTPRTGGVTAWCLDPHDLFAAKLAAWRVKDQLFLAAMLRHKFARPAVVKNRVAELPVSTAHKREMLAALGQLVTEYRRALRAKTKLSCPPH
jgi:hypothetical protein